mmetsp:Transcript_542/g.1600  ORF Transcript_542/g.1600 Transcript_542/m.1600 type:complete len:260 (-) Transcript_542:81-860(-)
MCGAKCTQTWQCVVIAQPHTLLELGAEVGEQFGAGQLQLLGSGALLHQRDGEREEFLGVAQQREGAGHGVRMRREVDQQTKHRVDEISLRCDRVEQRREGLAQRGGERFCSAVVGERQLRESAECTGAQRELAALGGQLRECLVHAQLKEGTAALLVDERQVAHHTAQLFAELRIGRTGITTEETHELFGVLGCQELRGALIMRCCIQKSRTGSELHIERLLSIGEHSQQEIAATQAHELLEEEVGTQQMGAETQRQQQ